MNTPPKVFEDDRQICLEGLACISEPCLEVNITPSEYFESAIEDHSYMLLGYMMARTGYHLMDCATIIENILEGNLEVIWGEVGRIVYDIERGMLH